MDGANHTQTKLRAFGGEGEGRVFRLDELSARLACDCASWRVVVERSPPMLYVCSYSSPSDVTLQYQVYICSSSVETVVTGIYIYSTSMRYLLARLERASACQR